MLPKILHFDNSTAVTGAYKALLSWCQSATEFEHIWILPEGSGVAEEAGLHFKVYTLPFAEIGKSPSRIIRYLPMLWLNSRKLKGIIKAERPDLLHANDLYNLLPYAVGSQGRSKIPLIVHARMLRRSFPAIIYDFWKRWHLKRADKVIAVSEAIRHDWDNDRRVEVVYDPITVSENLPPYHFLERRGDPFRFLYLANYIKGKGQEDAIEAVRILRDRGITNFHLDLFGGTMELAKNEAFKEELQHLIDSQSLAGLVTMHGLSRSVEQLMKQYDGLLHLSHAESFGMVCYEALYYGLPVISTDCGGPAEMMEPGSSGILLPVGDTAAFALAMEEFVGDPHLCERLSRNAPEFIRNRFNAAGRHLNSIFQELIDR